MLTALILLAGPAHAECDPTQLPRQLDAAEAAFSAGDALAVAASSADAVTSLECQVEPIDPQLSARLHRARALAQHLVGDNEAAVLSLRAMLHADPFFGLTAVDLAEAHGLHKLRLDAEEATQRWTSLRVKSDEYALVDGVRSLVAPALQPYVLQRLSLEGQVRSTRLIERGAAPGQGGSPGGGGSGRALDREPVSAATKRLRWAGVATGVVAGGLYGGAWGTHSAYQGAVAAQDDPAIGSLHSATNALSIGSAAMATTSLSMFVIGEMVKR